MMRENASLLQREIAAELNVSVNTIQGWESGKRTPVLMDLDAYLKVVGGSMTFGRVGVHADSQES
jgi:DNA-binding transcriptional regulator YiaG